VPLLAVAAAAVLGWRARARRQLRFLALAGYTVALAFVAVSRTTGSPYNYLFNWFRPAAAFLWLAVVWTLWTAWRARAGAGAHPRLGPVDLRVAAVVVAALSTAALSVSALGNGTGLDFQEFEASDRLAALVPGTVVAVRGQPRVYVRQIGGWCAGELGNGLAMQLVEHGTDVAVVPELANAYGNHRVRRDVAPTVELLCGPVANDAIRRVPQRPVAQYGILDDAELAELDALQVLFRERLTAAGRPQFIDATYNQTFPVIAKIHLPALGFDPHDLDRFEVLMGRAQNSAVVFFRPFGPNQPT
jgi:hypothetical protein